MKTYTLFSATILFLFSCGRSTDAFTEKIPVADKKNTPEEKSCIQPIAGLEIKPQVFNVSANVRDTICLKNGGNIIFPDNAFVDHNGKPVEGEVQVEWKEFHSLTEILFSGIPMTYDSAGVVSNFESGGMFTINASKDGEKLDLASGKSATVNLSSTNTQKDFNFYQLDDKSGAWSYLTSAEGEVIEDQKTESKKAGSKERLIDVMLNLTNFPELMNQEIVAWKPTNTIDRTKEVAIIRNANHLELEECDNGTYNILSDSVHGSLCVNVEPYTLENAEKESKAQEETFREQYLSTLQFQEDYRAGKIIRTVQINGFGTYNWDCQHRWENPERAVAQFYYPEEIDPHLVAVFFVSPEENLIVKCKSVSEASFAFDPKKRVGLIAIFPDNSVSFINNAEFQAANRTKKGDQLDLIFNESNLKLYSPSDINKYLKELI